MLRAVLAFTMLSPAAALGIDRYVGTSGADAGDCTVPALPCVTLQRAIDQSVAGDVIHVAAGAYAANLVTINKSITVLGAQAGVDARTRSGPESELVNTQGLWVSASNVILDGLTIRDSSNAAFTGHGVTLGAGVGGSRVVNNIFENNIAALAVANNGMADAVIQYNLFKNNNRTGATSGTGIYSDEFVSGGVLSRVRILDNLFENNANAAIGIAHSNVAQPATDISIANNTVDGGGRGIYFARVQGASVTGNLFSNLTAPIDGGSSVGVYLLGPASDIDISNNSLHTGARYGLRVAAGNANIAIHDNNVTSFVTAALQVDGAPTGPADYAACNWWGSSSGPTSSLNPTGTGDAVAGVLVLENFSPWLVNAMPGGKCPLFADGFE